MNILRYSLVTNLDSCMISNLSAIAKIPIQYVQEGSVKIQSTVYEGLPLRADVLGLVRTCYVFLKSTGISSANCYVSLDGGATEALVLYKDMFLFFKFSGLIANIKIKLSSYGLAEDVNFVIMY